MRRELIHGDLNTSFDWTIIKHMRGNRAAPVDHTVCSPQPAIVTLPGNLLKMQIIRPLYRSRDSKAKQSMI